MQWIKNENYIVDSSTGELICVLPQTPDELRDKIIEIAPEMFRAISSFVETSDNGSFKAKATYNELKKVLSRVPKHLLYDERVQI